MEVKVKGVPDVRRPLVYPSTQSTSTISRAQPPLAPETTYKRSHGRAREYVSTTMSKLQCVWGFALV